MEIDEFRSLPDQALIERFRSSGDHKYFWELVGRYKERIFILCSCVLRDKTVAEDLTHDTFIKAFRFIDSFEDDNFFAWLCKMAKNLCFTHLGKRIREKEITPDPTIPHGADQEVKLLKAMDVRDMINGLGNEQRVCLKLYIQGYRYKEIAEITGYPEQHVRSHIQNGKRNIKNRVEGRQTGEEERLQQGQRD